MGEGRCHGTEAHQRVMFQRLRGIYRFFVFNVCYPVELKCVFGLFEQKRWNMKAKAASNAAAKPSANKSLARSPAKITTTIVYNVVPSIHVVLPL